MTRKRNPPGYTGSAKPSKAGEVEIRPVLADGSRPRVRVPASSAVATALDSANDARKAVKKLGAQKKTAPKTKKAPSKSAAPAKSEAVAEQERATSEANRLAGALKAHKAAKPAAQDRAGLTVWNSQLRRLQAEYKKAVEAERAAFDARQLKLTNPGRRNPADERERVAALALRWHWGRYDQPKVERVSSKPWQPDSGFALGRLHALTVGGVQYETRGTFWLCADRQGKGTLFVVPPLPFTPGQAGPLERVEYRAQKGTDASDVIYDHKLEAVFPQARSRDGVLEIHRGQSRFLIDPERGLVEASEV